MGHPRSSRGHQTKIPLSLWEVPTEDATPAQTMTTYEPRHAFRHTADPEQGVVGGRRVGGGRWQAEGHPQGGAAVAGI